MMFLPQIVNIFCMLEVLPHGGKHFIDQESWSNLVVSNTLGSRTQMRGMGPVHRVDQVCRLAPHPRMWNQSSVHHMKVQSKIHWQYRRPDGRVYGLYLETPDLIHDIKKQIRGAMLAIQNLKWWIIMLTYQKIQFSHPTPYFQEVNCGSRNISFQILKELLPLFPFVIVGQMS